MTEQQILQVIGQLEASIDKIEAFLDNEEFKDYCDSVYNGITYWKVILKQIKNEN